MSEPTVEVTAVGRASCVPDRVLVQLGVHVTRESVGQALRAAAGAVEQLLGLLDEQGIAGGDRQTSGLSVEQGWDHEQQRSGGHTASYRLDLVVRDLDAAGLVVQQAGERVGDALRVDGFQLSVADPSEQQEQARRAAVQACRRQADQLADAAGVSLGDLVLLREGQQPGRGGGRGRFVLLESAGSGDPMPVEAGELSVAVTVTAVWRIDA